MFAIAIGSHDQPPDVRGGAWCFGMELLEFDGDF